MGLLVIVKAAQKDGDLARLEPGVWLCTGIACEEAGRSPSFSAFRAVS